MIFGFYPVSDSSGSPQQIFYNALPGQGAVDFTNAYVLLASCPICIASDETILGKGHQGQLLESYFVTFTTSRASDSLRMLPGGLKMQQAVSLIRRLGFRN